MPVMDSNKMAKFVLPAAISIRFPLSEKLKKANIRLKKLFPTSGFRKSL